MATPNNGTDNKTTSGFPKFEAPNVDLNAIVDSYKKNWEVLTLVNKMSAEVFNGIIKLQTAFVKQAMTDLGSVVEQGKKPADFIAKFNEVTRDTLAKAVSNNKEIADMIIASNNELTSTITNRVKESMEEAKHIVKSK